MSEPELYVQCFGQAVVLMRELRQISREELSQRSGVPLPILTGIEKGTISGMEFGLKEILMLARGIGISANRLMMAYMSKCQDVGEEP